MNWLKNVGTKYFMPTDATGPRTNNFNVIRIIAAAMVIYGHMSSLMGLPVHGVYGQSVSTLAVKILFIVSGYLVMKSLMSDSHFGRYMLRRSFRIFPGLIGVVLFAVFIVGPVFTRLPLSEYFASAGTWEYLRNILLYPVYALPGVFEGYTYPNAVNGSLWTMPVEFALYLALPVLLWIFKKLRITRLGLLIVTVALAVINYMHISYNPTARFVVYGTNWYDTFGIIPYFFAGSLFALPGMNKLFNLQTATLLMALTAIFRFSSVKCEFILCFVLPYFVLSFALVERPVFSHWFEKCDFSYGLYLYGFVVQQIVSHQLQKLNNPLFSLNVTFVICFALTFVCAVISWYVIEKPMQTLGKKIVSRSLKASA